MSIKVEEQQKIRFSKWGANKLFGDPDKRKEMSDEELMKLFDRVWTSTLENSITRATVCDPKDAYQRLNEKEKQFFDFEEEHRQFRIQEHNLEYVAQLARLDNNGYSLTQLWRIASSDINPKTLYITFETVDERKHFKTLANKLGFNDEELGLKLVNDFMAKFPKEFFFNQLYIFSFIKV